MPTVQAGTHNETASYPERAIGNKIIVELAKLRKERVYLQSRYMVWFNFIPGLNVVSLCLKLGIIHYHP